MLPLLMVYYYRSPSLGPPNLLFSSLSFYPLNITQRLARGGKGYIRVRDVVSGLRLLMVVGERMLMMVMFMRLPMMVMFMELLLVVGLLVVVIVRLRGWW